jgi:hypothetical protein
VIRTCVLLPYREELLRRVHATTPGTRRDEAASDEAARQTQAQAQEQAQAQAQAQAQKGQWTSCASRS